MTIIKLYVYDGSFSSAKLYRHVLTMLRLEEVCSPQTAAVSSDKVFVLKKKIVEEPS